MTGKEIVEAWKQDPSPGHAEDLLAARIDAALREARAEDPGAVGTPPDGEPGVIESATALVSLLDTGTPPLETLGMLRAALARAKEARHV
jgi:hypothetical protein